MISHYLSGKDTIEPWRLHVLPQERLLHFHQLLDGYAKCVDGNPIHDPQNYHFVTGLEENIWTRARSLAAYNNQILEITKLFELQIKHFKTNEQSKRFTSQSFHDGYEIRWSYSLNLVAERQDDWRQSKSLEDRAFTRQNLFIKLLELAPIAHRPLSLGILKWNLKFFLYANQIEQKSWNNATSIHDYLLRISALKDLFRTKLETPLSLEAASARTRPFTGKRLSSSSATAAKKQRKEQPNALQSLQDDDLCVCCMAEKVNVYLIACRHKCLCTDCFLEIGNHAAARSQISCPLCRRNVRILNWKFLL